MYALFLVILFILGACLGSFLCCQARRLRFHSKNQSPKITPAKKIKGNYKLGSRSICLKCGHILHWYDNIPLVSWFILRGRCRHCHQSIGWLEPVSEFGLAFTFLLFGIGFSVAQGFAFDPSFTLIANFNSALVWGHFLLSLILICFLGFLAIYDAAYGELPTLILIFSIILAAAILLLKQLNPFLVHGFTPTLILEPLGAVALLGGLYLFLYLVSKGRWVGDAPSTLPKVSQRPLKRPKTLKLNRVLLDAPFAIAVISPPHASRLAHSSSLHLLLSIPSATFSLFCFNYDIISLWQSKWA